MVSLDLHEPLGCVKFGNTCYGSDKTECALLYNNGPEPINFVAVLDEDAIAQEMVRLYHCPRTVLFFIISGK